MPLKRHGVPIQQCGDVGGGPRNVDQDGGNGAPGHGGRVDGTEEDEAGGRVHVEGERHKKCHGHGRAEPGGCPEKQTAQGAKNQDQQIDGGEGVGEILKEFSHDGSPSRMGVHPSPFRIAGLESNEMVSDPRVSAFVTTQFRQLETLNLS